MSVAVTPGLWLPKPFDLVSNCFLRRILKCSVIHLFDATVGEKRRVGESETANVVHACRRIEHTVVVLRQVLSFPGERELLIGLAPHELTPSLGNVSSGGNQVTCGLSQRRKAVSYTHLTLPTTSRV